MNAIKNKINSLIIFNFGYIFLIVSDMCKQVDLVRTYNKYISFFGYLFIAIYLLINAKKFLKMNKKHLLLIILGCLLLLVGFYFSRNFTIIRVILLCLSIMTMTFDKFVKYDVIYKVIIMTSLIVTSLFGITDNKVIYRSDLTKRYSLGFTHPNVLSMYLMMMIFEVSYLVLKNREHINKITRDIMLLLIPVAIIFTDYVTDSKTTMIILSVFYLFVIAYLFLYKYLKKFLDNKLIKNILIRMFFFASLAVVGTLIIAYTHPKYISIFDKIFSSRFSFYMVFLNKLHFNGLGMVIPDSINSAVLDNMYIKLFLNGGVIFWVTYYLLFRFSSSKTYKTDNYLILAIIVILCFVGMVETNILMPTLNIFMLYGLSNYFEEHNRKEQKNERSN